jgi:uncharacterized protein with FMN-binding domain
VTSVLASIGVLIVGWQAGSVVANAPSSTGTTASSPDTASSGSGSTTAQTTGSGSVAADGTYTGDDVNTRFGSVQVQITVSGGQIADVAAIQLTDQDRRSIQISNRAAPVLRSEVLQSQSANVSNVSGATYTSDAYLQSLQSAIDQAGL